MGSMDSWMFDKQVQVSVCLSGQYSLLMLTEAFEEEGIKVFMLNTDGLTVKCPKDKEAKLKEICKQWEETTNLILERVDYKKMIFSTVNDYLAITTDGKVKTKGDFETFSELWKNKSKGIIALALQEYFVKGIKPEVFVKNHKNLYDFCIRQKSNRNFNYELIDKDGNKEVLKKLIRYFIAKDGKRLFKIKNENCDTNAAKVSNVEAPDENGFQPLVYYMNGTPNNPQSLLQLIDFEYYIDKTEKIICKIEGRKFKSVRIEEKQLSLF